MQRELTQKAADWLRDVPSDKLERMCNVQLIGSNNGGLLAEVYMAELGRRQEEAVKNPPRNEAIAKSLSILKSQ